MKFLTLILFGLICCFNVTYGDCPNGIIVSGVSGDESTQIVNLHNDVRLKIARGELPGQPRGINLKRMNWDQSLANEAQNIANTCEFAHKSVTDSRFAGVGQNLFMSWTNDDQDSNTADWDAAVNSWINEDQQYQYPNGFSEATGHYTQVVWADTQFVGCGFSKYLQDSDYHKLYVCNYGPGGNVNNLPPYETGDSGCEDLC